MFQSSNIWGNLISSTVLKPVEEQNATISMLSNVSFCGFYDCPDNQNGTKISKPSIETVS
jgi:hypothetical protein